MKKFRKLTRGCSFVIQSRTLTKLWKMTRLTVLLILLGMGQAFALGSYAQATTLNLNFKNADLEEVLAEIEDQSEFFFLYNKDLIDVEQKVDVEVRNKKINEILDQLFEGKDIRYFLIDRQIVLSNHYGETGISGKENMMVQQQPAVSGTVTDESGLPLPGVTVVVKGTTQGTVTGADGNYSLSNIPEDATLVFSFVGMRTQEVEVGDQANINIEMAVDAIGIEEVVAVGYGTMRKSDLTGSVISVSGEELSKIPVSNIGNALQGKAAGVDVTVANGAPGGAPKIRIRGGNSISGGNEPLYVIDGFPTDNVLQILSPNDIQSIEILKDASATAIYGSRGANGVILITTKKGNVGATKITIDSYVGFNTITNKPELLNASQFIQLANEAAVNDGMPSIYNEPLASYGNTNWQDEILRTGIQQNYQLNVSGGTPKTRYSISGNYFSENGIVKNSDFNRGNLRFNVDSDISSKITFGTSVLIGRTSGNSLPLAGDGSVDRGGVISTALFVPPIVPIYNENGNYVFLYEEYVGQNPVAMINEIVNERIALNGIGNAFAEVELFKGLKVKILVGTNFSYVKNNEYLPSNTFRGSALQGSASVSFNQIYNWLNENTINYKKEFENHSFNILAGFTRQHNKVESLSGSANGFITDAFLFNSLQSGNTPVAPRTNASEWGLESYLGRINYIYKNKYLITSTMRYDGSSKFGKNNKFGLFPSGSFAWRLSEENFLDNAEYLNDLKLRLSYGITGNQAIPSYGSLASITASPWFGYIFGNAMNSGVGFESLENAGLEWEKTNQFDFGIDLSLWKGRLSFTADYYKKVTKDLLLSVNLPSHTGFDNAIQNIGKVQNKGVEFLLSADILVSKLEWNSSLNISANKNKVLDLGDTGEQYTGQGPFFAGINQYSIITEGEPLGAFYGYIFDGIYRDEEQIAELGHQPESKPGDMIYRDFDKSGKLSPDDRLVIGKAIPDLIIGMNNNFRYNNFDLSISMISYLGMERLNMNRYGLESLNGMFNNSVSVLNRWTPTNIDTDIPRATRTGHQYQVSTREVEDASFLRLRNVTLGYTLPDHRNKLKNIGISNLKIYATGMNLITFTNYSGFDPEIGTSDDRNPGGDYGNYPMPKTIIFGFNVSF